MSNLTRRNPFALAEWVVSTWTEDELKEYAVMAVVGKYHNDPGQFEQDFELMKAEQEEA